MVYQDPKWHNCHHHIKCTYGKVVKKIFRSKQMTLDKKVVLNGHCDKIIHLKQSPKIFDYVIAHTGSTPFKYQGLLVYTSHNRSIQSCLFYANKVELAVDLTHKNTIRYLTSFISK